MERTRDTTVGGATSRLPCEPTGLGATMPGLTDQGFTPGGMLVPHIRNARAPRAPKKQANGGPHHRGTSEATGFPTAPSPGMVGYS